MVYHEIYNVKRVDLSIVTNSLHVALDSLKDSIVSKWNNIYNETNILPASAH